MGGLIERGAYLKFWLRLEGLIGEGGGLNTAFKQSCISTLKDLPIKDGMMFKISSTPFLGKIRLSLYGFMHI